MRLRILILGLLAALVAGWALLQGFPVESPRAPETASAAKPRSNETYEEIDEDSRAQLREILRSAGDEDEAKR